MTDETKLGQNMTLNRRDFVRLASLLAGSAALAACAPVGTQGPEGAQPGTEAGQQQADARPPGKATIRWMTRAPAHALPAVQGIIQNQFMVDHADIEVVVEPAPEGWDQKLVTSMIAGDAQDVFEAWPAIWFEWVERDLVLDLQPYVDRDMSDEEVADFIEAQWEAQFIKGQRVGLPLYIDMRLETYNKDIFDEFNVDYPPEDGNWDWQDLTEMATQLTQDRDGDGQIDLWGLHLERGGWFYWPRMFGGDIVNPDDDTDCWLDHEKTQEAYNWIWDNQWRRQPNIIAQPAQVENQWYLNAFVPGWVAIAEKGLYPGEAAEAIGDQIRWDYAHVPNGPETRVSLGDADGWSIWKGSQQPDAAWTLIRFLTGPAYQENVVVRAIGYVPIRKSIMPNTLAAFREVWPTLQNVRLEVIPEAIEWGYLSNVRWFRNNVAAEEIINPAMELVFDVGEQEPSYLIEIAAQVEAAQQS